MNLLIDLPTKLKVSYYSSQQDTQRTIALKNDISKTSENRILSIIDSEDTVEQKTDLKTLFKVMSNPFITNKQISNSMKNYEFKVSNLFVR